MSPRPTASVGDFDMDLLLQLLNASEGRDELTSRAPALPHPDPLQPSPPEELAPSELDRLEAELLRLLGSAQPEGAVSGDVTDDVDNRLAARIVRGMSKSKAR